MRSEEYQEKKPRKKTEGYFDSHEVKSDTMRGRLEPAQLSADQWDLLEETVRGSKYARTIAELRRAGNAPLKARDILPEESINQGNENVNNIFRLQKIPYRLVRVGGLSGEMYSRDRRHNRLLALVEWPDTQADEPDDYSLDQWG